MSYITVVTPIDQFCGKTFDLVNGEIVKGKTSVMSKARAQHVLCESLEVLAKIINGLREGDAIILGYVAPLIKKRVRDFYLLSEREMRVLCQTNDAPLTAFKYGHHCAQRKKANFKRAPFICIDRDVDDNVPEQIKKVQELSNAEFLKVLCSELGPSVSQAFYGADFLPVVSSSGQVFTPNGTPYSKDPSAHLYFKVSNASDIDRFSGALTAHAFGSGFMHNKQINRTDDIEAYRRVTIFDPSVFTIGRLFFEGPPQTTNGVLLKRSPCRVVKWNGQDVRTHCVGEPTGEMLKALNLQNLNFKRGKVGGYLESNTLPRNTVIETKMGPMTAEMFERSGIERLRCQALRSGSVSWAAYLGRHDDGSCFLFDSGTTIKHKIEPAPVVTERTNVDVMLEGLFKQIVK
ncbi:hypothetical protein [Photobacterium angustum]|uniref:hypothetical protein n=1 Tax=Photobacterium angustum TaxID=661 RepID=UPI0005E776FB|nr:hypothetical protein [Photobacterium angustum]KJG00091.1 hypothetical protein UB35_19755 [Photobacterium angustum]PSV61690.1 hypothetical protein CTM95_20525 [Photobacterium angustum]